jgi:tRNA pseudouridine55 synthase
MFGFLNLDKPAGLTSRDVVNRVERIVRPLKAGHAGTLDPLATGVLVVAIGQATRLIEYVQRMPKTYRGTFLLGYTSDTEDIEGTVVALPSALQPSLAELQAVLPRFVGTIEQRPPAYSALKVGGRRSYDLARRGQAVELAPRPVVIHAINLVRYEYPALELVVQCGSGTYLRSLGRDIARAVGSDAVMSALRREAIGPFLAEAALGCDELSPDRIAAALQPAALAVRGLTQIRVTPQEQARLLRGQPLPDRRELPAGEAAAVDGAGTLVAVLRVGARGLEPTKCFGPSAG